MNARMITLRTVFAFASTVLGSDTLELLDPPQIPPGLPANVVTALKTRRTNLLPWFVQSLCREDESSPEAAADRAQAVALCRKVGEGQREFLAMVLSVDAVARINGLRNKVSGSYAEWKNDAEAMQAMLRELDAIVAAAVEARTIDPSLGLAWAAEAQTLAVRANLRMDLGQPADLRSARAAADQTLRRFPQLPDAHFALAMVATYEAKELASSLLPDRAQLAAKKKEVFGALAEAVRLDPTYGRAYLFRAGLYAAFGEAQEALDDLRQAQKLVPGLDPRLEASIRAMLDEAPTAPPAAHSQVTAQSHATA